MESGLIVGGVALSFGSSLIVRFEPRDDLPKSWAFGLAWFTIYGTLLVAAALRETRRDWVIATTTALVLTSAWAVSTRLGASRLATAWIALSAVTASVGAGLATRAGLAVQLAASGLLAGWLLVATSLALSIAVPTAAIVVGGVGVATANPYLFAPAVLAVVAQPQTTAWTQIIEASTALVVLGGLTAVRLFL